MHLGLKHHKPTNKKHQKRFSGSSKICLYPEENSLYRYVYTNDISIYMKSMADSCVDFTNTILMLDLIRNYIEKLKRSSYKEGLNVDKGNIAVSNNTGTFNTG